MNIQPYTEAITVSAANFPCCKLFLKCDETSGTTLTDAISGNAITPGIAMAFDTSNAVKFVAGATASNLSLGKTIAIGTKSALRLTVCNMGLLPGANLGTSGLAKITLSSTGMTISDGTNTASPSLAPTQSAIVGASISFTSGTANEGTSRQVTLTTLTGPTNGTATPADLTNMGNITHYVTLGSTIGDFILYGDALFVFDNGIPADANAAIAWMTARWQAGYKEIYPGWKDLA